MKPRIRLPHTPEEEIVRNFSLCPTGSPVREEVREIATNTESMEMTLEKTRDSPDHVVVSMDISPEKVPTITKKIESMTLESPPKITPPTDVIVPKPSSKKRATFSQIPIIHMIPPPESLDLEVLTSNVDPIFPDLETLIPEIFLEIPCSDVPPDPTTSDVVPDPMTPDVSRNSKIFDIEIPSEVKTPDSEVDTPVATSPPEVLPDIPVPEPEAFLDVVTSRHYQFHPYVPRTVPDPPENPQDKGSRIRRPSLYLSPSRVPRQKQSG
ncbi:unnamed protein product [Allacma fusca]|uniref:Uncharacterized protein n=1 Tax=Allacma fusca TaxID=39272 RepID=A0A8J2LBM6_9HEXA|nr:unnamed protein product [Allacma fusca]